jgi:hypothetical protein
MTRLLLTLISLVLVACAAPPKPDAATAQDTSCKRELQVGSMLPSVQCRTAQQREQDRIGVDATAQALKNHPAQSPLPTGGK